MQDDFNGNKDWLLAVSRPNNEGLNDNRGALS
jgi:hypothetical protein